MIAEYHKTRAVLDMTYIESVFLQDERELLHDVSSKHPNSIVRMPGWDTLTPGYKGSVPPSDLFDGKVIQL